MCDESGLAWDRVIESGQRSIGSVVHLSSKIDMDPDGENADVFFLVEAPGLAGPGREHKISMWLKPADAIE